MLGAVSAHSLVGASAGSTEPGSALCFSHCFGEAAGANLETPALCPSAEQQELQWSGVERQPPPWTDELAEMSRHIYTRHGIDGLQKPVFQVG